ncbi:MAG TPA: MlaD family protein [Verrucomicrobiae bacterium]|nr:MlaD family protein [Verrucomicrobiae bacterium]
MPSQKQLRWSELKVGITVVVGSVTLALLVFLISGTGGLFTKKIMLISHFDNAEGLRPGQPVDLQGLPIGNVQSIRVVPVTPDRPKSPIEVIMKVNAKYQPFIHEDSKATIETAGVLGESFVDIDSLDAKGPIIRDNAELKPGNAPGIQDIVKSSQTSLQNVDVLVKRADKILAEIQSGKGSLGQFISDPATINKVNGILNQIQALLNDVSNGKGTIGKFFSDDSLYRKANDAVDKIDRLVDEINAGKGNLGKLVKDESLYNNANQTIAKANKLVDDLNAGKGAAGTLLKDEEFARKLRNTLEKLSAITDRLEAGEGTAGRLLKDPSIYNNTDQMLVETRNLVKAIRENPKKYLTIHFRVF